MSECKECKGKGWIFSGFGEDHECETCFDKSPEPENIVEQSQPDEWNEAGTKPDHPCLCETKTRLGDGAILNGFQYWTGKYWGFACGAKDQAMAHSDYPESVLVEIIQWREVQS